LKEYNAVVTNNTPLRRHSKLLEYLRRCARVSLGSVVLDLTPEQPVGLNAPSPIQGDPILNDPNQPLIFETWSEVDFNEVTFKGTIMNGLRLPNCTKLTIAGCA